MNICYLDVSDCKCVRINGPSWNVFLFALQVAGLSELRSTMIEVAKPLCPDLPEVKQELEALRRYFKGPQEGVVIADEVHDHCSEEGLSELVESLRKYLPKRA